MGSIIDIIQVSSLKVELRGLSVIGKPNRGEKLETCRQLKVERLLVDVP
jgi:hypothetical protein